MANIKRVRVVLSGGGVVGPSVITHYFTAAATGFPADLKTFYLAINAGFPDDLNWEVPNTGDLLSETNGSLQGVWTDSGGGTGTGGSNSVFSKGAGMFVEWVTAGIRGGRRVSGRTFLVPLASVAFDTTGKVSPTYASTVSTAAAALISAQGSDFVVWGKPHSKAANDGESNAILAAVAHSEPTTLRSRRV